MVLKYDCILLVVLAGALGSGEMAQQSQRSQCCSTLCGYLSALDQRTRASVCT